MKAKSGEIIGPNYAHTVGRTFCTISKDGNSCITVSEDTYAKVFPVEGSKVIHERPKEMDSNLVLYAADSNKNLCICGSDEEAAVYDIETGEVAQVLMRATLPVRGVAISPNGQWVAVASDDMMLKLFEISSLYDNPEKGEAKDHALQGIKSSGCFCVFSPDSKSLSVLCSDGSVLVYSVNSKELIHQIEDATREKLIPEDYFYSVSYSADGKYLAVPAQKEIRLFDAHQYKEAGIILKSQEDIKFVDWSADKRYLLGGNEKRLFIWNVNEKQIINELESEDAQLVNAKFHPALNMLVATDQNGQLTVWEKPIPASDFAKHELVETSNNVPAGQGHLNSGQKVEKKMETVSKKKKTKSDFVSQEAEKVDDEDEEMEDIVSLKDLHEDEDDDDDVMYDNGSDLDDFVEYSEGEQHLVEKYVKRSKPVSRTKPITSVSTLSIAPVKYIQPNATEFTANHQKRYLCYNLVGIVSTSTSTTGENMVEIDFHDVSQGRNMHFKDTFGFHLASLGQDGCLFASAYKKDDDLPSTIFFKSFDSWSQSQEIKFSLESGEEALLLTLSTNGWFAVYTSFDNLRIYSQAGVPLMLWSASSTCPIVSMNSRGDYLFLVYQELSPVLHYKFQIVDVKEKRSVTPLNSLPTTKTKSKEPSFICWIGFTENASSVPIPISYDSEGVLRMAFPHEDYQWTPVLDTRIAIDGKQDFYWPVGVTEEEMMMIICKAGERQPTVFPKPIMSDIQLSVPLAANNTDNIQEQCFRQTLLLEHYDYSVQSGKADVDVYDITGRQGSVDKLLLQQINRALKSKNSILACDLCSMLNLEKSLHLAYQLAGKNGEKSVAERIEEIKNEKFNKMEDEDQPVHVEQLSKRRVSTVSLREDRSNDVQFTPVAPSKIQSNENFSSAKKTPIPLDPLPEDSGRSSPVDAAPKVPFNNPFRKRTAEPSKEEKLSEDSQKASNPVKKKKLQQTSFKNFLQSNGNKENAVNKE